VSLCGLPEYGVQRARLNRLGITEFQAEGLAVSLALFTLHTPIQVLRAAFLVSILQSYVSVLGKGATQVAF
jgi:hypothetical protein